MIIVNTETVAGYTITETTGLVRGSSVRARHLGRDIFAAIKNLVGGEIPEYSKLLANAREQAMQRMKNEAASMNADAIVNVRFTSAQVMQGSSEILAYGTAVKIKRHVV